MTLTVLCSTGQLFLQVVPQSSASFLALRLELWRKTTEVPLSSHHVKDTCYHVRAVTDDVNLGHSAEIVFVSLLHTK